METSDSDKQEAKSAATEATFSEELERNSHDGQAKAGSETRGSSCFSPCRSKRMKPRRKKRKPRHQRQHDKH